MFSAVTQPDLEKLALPAFISASKFGCGRYTSVGTKVYGMSCVTQESWMPSEYAAIPASFALSHRASTSLHVVGALDSELGERLML